ncbi:MAG: hypothetical protein BWY75_03608 [bacterium ADurb.Bin425]|nr:MAG: hypothetical protein BWY75_03608 [bacterium ADurb.Bin425]
MGSAYGHIDSDDFAGQGFAPDIDWFIFLKDGAVTENARQRHFRLGTALAKEEQGKGRQYAEQGSLSVYGHYERFPYLVAT